jgi:hypothetical protein
MKASVATTDATTKLAKATAGSTGAPTARSVTASVSASSAKIASWSAVVSSRRRGAKIPRAFTLRSAALRPRASRQALEPAAQAWKGAPVQAHDGQGTPAASRHSTATGADHGARLAVQPEDRDGAERGEQVGAVVADRTSEHRGHRNPSRHPAPRERADHEQRSAHAGRRECLIGEELGQAEGHETEGLPGDSLTHQRALPDGARTQVGERLEQRCRQQPDRLGPRQEARERLLLGEMRDDEHEAGEQQRTAEPGEVGGCVEASHGARRVPLGAS